MMSFADVCAVETTHPRSRLLVHAGSHCCLHYDQSGIAAQHNIWHYTGNNVWTSNKAYMSQEHMNNTFQDYVASPYHIHATT